MRKTCLALLALCCASHAAWGQPAGPAPAAPLDPSGNALDSYLLRWEESMKKLNRLAEDSSLAFLFGMKAAEAKTRYELKLHNVDANYVYVDVVPRNAVDRADFTKARLVLNKDTFLPRQLWFEHTGGEVLWDMPNV